MASKEAIDVKLEAFGNCMEEKMRSLFAEFSIGRLSNPRKSQHRETSDRQDDPKKHGHITSDINNPCMKVDFPRWEGDPIGWISRAEHYFWFYRTADATRVEFAAIHLEGNAIQDELRERSTKELCWHCDEPWSHEHHCKKGQLLVIELVDDEDNGTSEEALEPKEEAMEEESQPANYAVHALAGYSNLLMIAPTKEPELEDTTLEPKENDIPQLAIHTVPTLASYTNLQKLKIEGFLEQQFVIILIDVGSTHNFMSSKVDAHLMLQKEYYNRFEVKVANGQILKCNQKCSWVKLILQEQDVVADFFLLPLDGFDIVLGIDWLSTIGDIL
ncbi:hypothetical protein GW17_00028145 [Ensete ventricosum]|nr:hypothetical protein GW17_00028145 [Ensete ventricosum]